MSLKRLRLYVDDLRRACSEYGENPFFLAALVLRESGAGVYLSPQGPTGKGDGGHGHGLCQIDDRTWGEWLRTHDWHIPVVSFRKACEILAADRRWLKNHHGMPTVNEALFERTVYASYNCGPARARSGLMLAGDPDKLTTGGDYSRWIFERAAKLKEQVPELAPTSS